MKKTEHVTPKFVDQIPTDLLPGELYISEKHRTAVHLCPCGCRNKVVTPLKPYGWRLIREVDGVSLRPSIGNWAYPCQSHYWITKNLIEWGEALSEADISRVRTSDKHSRDSHFKRGLIARVLNWIRGR